MGRLPQERGVSSVSAHHFSFETDQDWWSRIGLGYSGVKPGTRFGNRVRASLLKILREHPPVAFAGGDNGATLSLDDFAALIEAAAADAVRAGEEEERITAETLREEGSARVEQAYAMPDADSLITEGAGPGSRRARRLRGAGRFSSTNRTASSTPTRRSGWRAGRNLRRANCRRCLVTRSARKS